jgi:hypothetical protein
MVADRCLAPRTGAPSIVAAQLVTSTAGAGFAVFAKAPSILWPLPLHEELVQKPPAGMPRFTCCMQCTALCCSRQVRHS